MQIWDTAGQERYRTITNAYYKGADGIIVVFDMTNKESFLSIDGWLSEVEKHSGNDVSVMVFANKSDCTDEIVVTDKEIREFEETHKIPVVKTSAKEGTGVDDSFLELTKKLIVKKNEQGGDDRKRNMGLTFQKMQLGKKSDPNQSSMGGACCKY